MSAFALLSTMHNDSCWVMTLIGAVKLLAAY